MKQISFHIGKWVIASFILIILFCSFEGPGKNENLKNKVKAAYIYKFTKYIEWDINPNDSAAFKIVITKNNPLVKELRDSFLDKKINGHNVRVIETLNYNNLSNAQILYLSGIDKTELKTIVDKYRSKQLLLITENEGYAELGSHINFYITPTGNMHFEININRIRESNIKVNTLLLEFAKIVKYK